MKIQQNLEESNARQQELRQAYLRHLLLYVQSRDPNLHLFRTLADNWYAYHRGGDYLRRMREVVFNRGDLKSTKCRSVARHWPFVSKEAALILDNNLAVDLAKDHSVPLAVIRRVLLHRNLSDIHELEELLTTWYSLGLVTGAEHKSLIKHGFGNKMPSGFPNDPHAAWDESWRTARYAACGVMPATP